MMTLINFTKHSTYVYDKRWRRGSCWLGERIMEFWVEKQGCLPPMLPPNFFTILYVVESFTKFTYYVKNRNVCRRSSSHQLNFCTILYFVESFAEFTYMKNNDVCRRSSHQTLMLTPTLAIQLAHFCTFCTFFLAKQIWASGQQHYRPIMWQTFEFFCSFLSCIRYKV